MKYGIIADIHSNLEALETVLLELSGVDKIVCLGDIVGYGPNPNECCQKIRELKCITVAGNHEKAVIQEMSLEFFNKNAGEAVLWTREKITPDNFEYLKRLPLIEKMDDFVAVHGSLRNPLEEYLTSLAEGIPTLEEMEAPICFVGHSHVPLVIFKSENGSYDGRRLQDREEINTKLFTKMVLNPGGVGQPRDRDPRASYAIYDSEKKLATFYRVSYNIGTVQEKMRQENLPVSLIERIAYGR